MNWFVVSLVITILAGAAIISGPPQTGKEQAEFQAIVKEAAQKEEPSPSPSPKPITEKKVEAEPETDSLDEKIVAFEELARSQGYPEEEIQAFVTYVKKYGEPPLPNGGYTPSYSSSLSVPPAWEYDDSDYRLSELERKQQEMEQAQDRQNRAKSYDCINSGGVWSRFNNVCNYY